MPGDRRHHHRHSYEKEVFRSHHHRRSSPKDPHIFHHKHYRDGSLVSSFTELEGRGLVGQADRSFEPEPETTPVRVCAPKNDEEGFLNKILKKKKRESANKRIELVVKQEPISYEVERPIVPVVREYQTEDPVRRVTPVVRACQTEEVTRREQAPPVYPPPPPIYAPPPPARDYEVYRDITREKHVSFEREDRQNLRSTQTTKPEIETISQGTGGRSMTLLQPKMINESIGPSTTEISENEEKKVVAKVTRGTEVDNTNYFVPPAPPYVQFVQEVASGSTVKSEHVDIDLCPLCHKGWYVKKFTWSGIVAALFCFPCGILMCFLMRTYVCSFCGEPRVAPYTNYEEEAMEKRDDGSKSRIVPPNNHSDDEES